MPEGPPIDRMRFLAVILSAVGEENSTDHHIRFPRLEQMASVLSLSRLPTSLLGAEDCMACQLRMFASGIASSKTV